jgi:hypothetical protein
MGGGNPAKAFLISLKRRAGYTARTSKIHSNCLFPFSSFSIIIFGYLGSYKNYKIYWSSIV